MKEIIEVAMSIWSLISNFVLI